MFSAEVSWRCEPGINRAYVWLSDGTVVGYRDLNSWLDFPAEERHRQLLEAVLAEWVPSTGVPSAVTPREPGPPPLRGTGLRGLLHRRRASRDHAKSVRAYENWRQDRPLWRIPTDPPHGGWRDLVRNDAGQALWQRAAELPVPKWHELAAKREARAWRVGAMGEETVADELFRLTRSADWRFVHSVPVGNRGSDIDHVLVGPGGVFTINTKMHRDASIWVGESTFLVNGQKRPYLRNSRHEAARASRLLSAAAGFEVSVRPLIIVVDPRGITYKRPPSDVAVITRRGLNRWSSSLDLLLSSEQISEVFSVVRRSSTWT